MEETLKPLQPVRYRKYLQYFGVKRLQFPDWGVPSEDLYPYLLSRKPILIPGTPMSRDNPQNMILENWESYALILAATFDSRWIYASVDGTKMLNGG